LATRGDEGRPGHPTVARGRFVARLAIAVLLVGAPRVVTAQIERAVQWTARVPKPAVVADTVRVTLHGAIVEFFHLYSATQGPGGPVRTTIDAVPSSEWRIRGPLRAPPPDTIPDGNFGIMSEVYDDSVSIGVTLERGAETRAEPALAVRYQACTSRYCLPPRTDTVRIVLASAKRTAPTAPVVATPTIAAVASHDTSIAEGFARVEQQASVATFGSGGGPGGGPGAFLLLAASMGALALLTPCVFPMVPITVTSFMGSGRYAGRGVAHAALYALGIIASFAGLGTVTAALFGASGLARFSAHPAVNLAIAALFIVFALSLIGVITLRLPSSLMTRLASVPSRGALGAFAMGSVFTLTAFTCTAPFIGTLLVMSSQGNWRWPLAGMLAFATVFAAPFFVLALVPGLVRRTPRAGAWMPALEMTIGAIELGAAVKFISNADLVLGWGIFTRSTVIAIWIAILVVLAASMVRRLPRHRVIAVAGIAAVISVLVPGLFGKRLGELDAFLPPLGTQRGSGELSWMLNDYRAALATAARERRPILIDFTGYTCTNCRWMEANMFPRADVKQSLDRFVRVRLYTDGVGQPFEAQQLLEQRMFGTVALPLYAALDPSGRPRARFLGMTRDPAEFIQFLNEADGSR